MPYSNPFSTVITLVPLIAGEEAIERRCSYQPIFNRRVVRIEGGCSCRLVFNKKRVPVEGGMHVGSF